MGSKQRARTHTHTNLLPVLGGRRDSAPSLLRPRPFFLPPPKKQNGAQPMPAETAGQPQRASPSFMPQDGSSSASNPSLLRRRYISVLWPAEVSVTRPPDSAPLRLAASEVAERQGGSWTLSLQVQQLHNLVNQTAFGKMPSCL